MKKIIVIDKGKRPESGGICCGSILAPAWW